MAETYSVTASGVAASAATAKTVIEIAAGATVSGRLIAADVTFRGGVTTTSKEVLVELVRYATTGTGTAYTPLKANGEGQARAANITAKTNMSAEPGTPTVLKSWYVPAVSGLLQQLPLGREWWFGNGLIGLRVTSPDALTVAANMEIEE